MPQRRLIVVGEGSELESLRSKAGPNVRLVGHQSPEDLRRYLQLGRAFIFAAEEDFGIVPVEAMACGTPVIAFGRGGVTESVTPGVTGLFFPEQSPESLVNAIHEFEELSEKRPWNADTIRQNAERFSASRFRADFGRFVEREWSRFRAAQQGTSSLQMPISDSPIESDQQDARTNGEEVLPRDEVLAHDEVMLHHGLSTAGGNSSTGLVPAAVFRTGEHAKLPSLAG
jgi:hypothetical protein